MFTAGNVNSNDLIYQKCLTVKHNNMECEVISFPTFVVNFSIIAHRNICLPLSHNLN